MTAGIGLTHSFGYHTARTFGVTSDHLSSPRKDACDRSLRGSSPSPTGLSARGSLVFLRLGLVSFGGPIAHIGYFRAEIVERRKWIHAETFADLLGALPVSAGAGEQRARRRARHDARGLSRRARRLDRLHGALRAGDDRLRLWDRPRRASRDDGLSARPENSRGCGGRAGGLGDGENSLSRSRARDARRRRGDSRARLSLGAGADRRDYSRRLSRLALSPGGGEA